MKNLWTNIFRPGFLNTAKSFEFFEKQISTNNFCTRHHTWCIVSFSCGIRNHTTKKIAYAIGSLPPPHEGGGGVAMQNKSIDAYKISTVGQAD